MRQGFCVHVCNINRQFPLYGGKCELYSENIKLEQYMTGLVGAVPFGQGRINYREELPVRPE